jgi:putative inorganic carbon (HCO3(-)) transporter
MTSTPLFATARATAATLRFSHVLLLAIALNFLCANGHDQQRCIELAVLALGLLGALATGQLARALQSVPLRLRAVGLAFLALGACAAIGTISPGRAMAEWSMFVVLGLSAIIVADEVAMADAVSRYRLLQTLGWLCALYSLRVLLVYGAALAVHTPLEMHGMAVGFSNMRFLNHAQTALLPLLVWLIAVSARGSWTRRVAFAVASFWCSLILFGEARATILALALGAAIAWAVRGRRAAPWLNTLAAALLGGVLLYVLLYILIPIAAGLPALGLPGNMLARSAADPASGRMFLWRRAAELIAHHPVLGVGPQHFAHFGADLQIGAHPHDWLLQIATEWGVPALLCALFLLGAGARGLLRAGKAIAADDARNQAMCTTLIVALAAVVVDSLFSGVLVMPQSQMSLVLVFGIAMGWTRSLRPSSALQASAATRIAGVALALSAICTLAAVAGPDAARKWEGGPLTAQEQAHNHGMQWPRLWQAGYF